MSEKVKDFYEYVDEFCLKAGVQLSPATEGTLYHIFKRCQQEAKENPVTNQATLKSHQVESDTKPGMWYTLTEQVDGTWRCNCPSFFHRERCKHVARTANDDS